jgi:hypothetical protein
MPTARVIRAHHHTAVFHDQHRIVSTDRPDVSAHQHANRLSGSIVPVARSGLLNVPSAALAIGRDLRSRQPDIRDPRHGGSPQSRGSVYAASMVARTGVGDRLGLAAGPHPLPAKIVVM